MAVVGREVRRAVPLPLGVQVLAAANREALAVALACGAAFVRVEGFVFAHVADEGLMEADAGALLRYRTAIGAEQIRVFADIKKKHSSHAITADVDVAETARAAEFALADGVIVTGAATGQPADARRRSRPPPPRSASRCSSARASRPDNIDRYPRPPAGSSSARRSSRGATGGCRSTPMRSEAPRRRLRRHAAARTVTR